MNSFKKIIKKCTTSKTRNQIRKLKRKIKEFFFRKKKTELSDLKKILIDDFGLKKGDCIIVASSFGNLNANYSPREVIELLQSIVTEEGSIMMPFYPPINSTECAKGNHVFDMENTKSGMGILTNVFAQMPNVIKSMHPIKAVCVWGKNASEIIANHDKSTTPFYWDSPYGRYVKLGSKSIGLGLKNIPIFHTLEDVFSDPFNYYYQKDKYNLILQVGERQFTVKTYVHNDKLFNNCISPGEYVASLKCKTYKKVNFGYAFLYVVDNNELYNKTKEEFRKGHTRLKK